MPDAEIEAQPREQVSKPRPTRRIMLILTILMFVVMGLALLVGVVGHPVYKTHRALEGTSTQAIRAGKQGATTVWRLGGPEEAARTLSFYRRMPLWVAPRREEAVFLLAFCGRYGVADLCRALRDPDSDVRGQAALALYRALIYSETPGHDIGANLAGIAGGLKDTEPYVRGLCADALREAGPEAAAVVPELIAALSDPDGGVRQRAARALGAIGDPGALGALKKLETLASGADDWTVRDAAREAMTDIRAAQRDAEATEDRN
jgi:HEAT repeat protein